MGTLSKKKTLVLWIAPFKFFIRVSSPFRRYTLKVVNKH